MFSQLIQVLITLELWQVINQVICLSTFALWISGHRTKIIYILKVLLLARVSILCPSWGTVQFQIIYGHPSILFLSIRPNQIRPKPREKNLWEKSALKERNVRLQRINVKLKKRKETDSYFSKVDRNLGCINTEVGLFFWIVQKYTLILNIYNIFQVKYSKSSMLMIF